MTSTRWRAPADPETLGPVIHAVTGEPVNELGGAWSTYWYNGFIYDSDITTGLNVFNVSDRAMAEQIELPTSTSRRRIPPCSSAASGDDAGMM